MIIVIFFMQPVRFYLLHSHCIIVFLCRTCLDMVADETSSLQSAQKDFEGGVHLGIGGFNLVRECTVNSN